MFGINNLHVQKLISELQATSCTLEEWNDEAVLQQVFQYHLKKQTRSDINWIEFIRNWRDKESEIIELQTSLVQVYGPKYKISPRELRGWKSMLRHMGCNKITPYNKDQSEVRNIDDKVYSWYSLMFY